MRTTLNLPEKLINEAMLAAKLPTKTATIKMALEQLIRRSKTIGIMQYGGKVDLDIDLDVLRKKVVVLVDSSVWISYFRKGRQTIFNI